ncbi:hypothetical protein [Sphingomonas sp. S2M10]|uniref:hypothetical protein n=1 Tax=Sphingomonas sp. S2M10 TaxID=2705010 RepID=UPI001456EBBD|nr:hypothetical protein [Sphingomonas sp. S2M10]
MERQPLVTRHRKGQRIDSLAGQADLVMAMAAGRSSGRADAPDEQKIRSRAGHTPDHIALRISTPSFPL